MDRPNQNELVHPIQTHSRRPLLHPSNFVASACVRACVRHRRSIERSGCASTTACSLARSGVRGCSCHCRRREQADAPTRARARKIVEEGNFVLPAGHGRALLPRAPAPGLLLPHRQDPLRAPRAHRRHPDAADDGGGDQRGRVAADRQDHEPHRAGGLRHRRVRQDPGHPPHQAGDVRQEAVATALQGAAPAGAPPHPRPTQRRARVPEGQGRHPADGRLPARRRERLQLGRDGEGQVGARAEAAGARPVPGGGARAGAQGGAPDQRLRQLQPQNRRRLLARAAVGRGRRGAADVRAQPLAVRAGPAVGGGPGGQGEPDRVQERARRGGGAGGTGGAAPPPPVPRLRAAAAGGDAAARPVIERDETVASPPLCTLLCTSMSRAVCVVKKKKKREHGLCFADVAGRFRAVFFLCV